MVPIRKGDGTGLAAAGYSQVRKGDGTVLWNAIPDSVVEDFERGNLDPYKGDTGNYNIETNEVIQGDNSLEFDIGTQGHRIYSLPGDGLEYYPVDEDTIRWLVYTDGDIQLPSLLTNVEETTDEINAYAYEVVPGDRLTIRRLDDEFSSSTKLARSDDAGTADTWYWAQRSPIDDGEHTLSLHEVDETPITEDNVEESFGDQLDSVSTTDLTYVGEGEGVGFRARSDGDGDFVDYVITV